MRIIANISHISIIILWASPTNDVHDFVVKWKHFPRYWPFVRGIHRSPINSPHKGQWQGALIFSLICAWTNGWVSHRDASDLRRSRAHYDVIVMKYLQLSRYQTHRCCIMRVSLSQTCFISIPMRKKLATVTAHRELTVSSRWVHGQLTVTKMVTASRDLGRDWLWPSRDWAVIAVIELWPRRDWAVT